MNAIYKGKLYKLEDDLMTVRLTDTETGAKVSTWFGDPELIIDPTDDEINNILPDYNAEADALSLKAKAAQVWQAMDANEKTGVRFGLFPAGKMREAEAQGFTARALCVELMSCAKADGGMRA